MGPGRMERWELDPRYDRRAEGSRRQWKANHAGGGWCFHWELESALLLELAENRLERERWGLRVVCRENHVVEVVAARGRKENPLA